MYDSLRERQKQVARELILRAAADEIVEKGLEQVSLQVVADRAGVSKRTLYNYFESREALLAGIGEWSDQMTLEMVGFLVPEGLDSLPEMVAPIWRAWREQGSIYEASICIDRALTEIAPSAGRLQRRAALARSIAHLRPELSEQQCELLGSMLHVLVSAPVYRRLTIEDGTDLEDAARLVAWAVTTLRDSISQGNDPFPKEEQQ